MATIIKEKLVPGGKWQKSNWYHSRDRNGYKKVNAKHTLLGFVYGAERVPLRLHPEHQKWSWNTRNQFSKWQVTTDRQWRTSGRGIADIQLSLFFA